jgi:hypothetical protein
LIGLALAGSVTLGLAQNTNPTNTFDNAASTTSFVTWWGPPNPIMTWDETLDAGNDPNSGSVRYDQAFTGTASEQFMTFFTIANRWQWDFGYVLDATTYTNLSFDLKVDASTGQRRNANDFGWLEIGLCTGSSGPGTTYLPGRAIPLSATNWTRFDYPLNPTLANIDQVSGFFIKMWSNGDHTNSLIFNVDNFAITKPTVPVVIPPPTVSLIPAKPKLNLLASGTGQYDRQQIRTVDSAFSWVGATEPVTYEFTIKDSPGASNPGYQAHMFLVPNSTDGANAIDWNASDVIWLHIENLDNGGGQATFRYKTNRPGGNDMFFNTDPEATRTNVVEGVTNVTLITVGNLGTIPSTNILGTWKVTFENDTSITMITSDGTSTNFTLAPEAAALFGGTMQAFFGAQPNNLSYGGLGYVLDHVKISTPTITWIEDDFTGGTLDPVKWVKQAADAPGVFVVPTNSPWALSWTLPAAGFEPQISTDLAPGSTWVSPLSTEQIKIQASVRTYLSSDELSPSASYFRMIKRTFTKLQVLLPGETAAPGTPTGKTGTPTPQILSTPFDIVVNAVDDEWYLINNVTHTVTLSSTDASALLPSDAALVGGTQTFNVYLNDVGSFTITATDVTDPTKTANTSSPATVSP